MDFYGFRNAETPCKLLVKALDECIYKERYIRRRKRRICAEGAYLDRIPVPDVALEDQRFEIRAPSVTCPPEDLNEEFVICLEGRCQSALWAHLHVHLPAMAHQPAGHVLVISGNEWVPAKYGHAMQYSSN